MIFVFVVNKFIAEWINDIKVNLSTKTISVVFCNKDPINELISMYCMLHTYLGLILTLQGYGNLLLQKKIIINMLSLFDTTLFKVSIVK